MWGGGGQITPNSDCCQMAGVTCVKKGKDDIVTRIQWPSNDLEGNLGSDIRNLPDLEKL